jgi:hypothetical protein
MKNDDLYPESQSSRIVLFSARNTMTPRVNSSRRLTTNNSSSKIDEFNETSNTLPNLKYGRRYDNNKNSMDLTLFSEKPYVSERQQNNTRQIPNMFSRSSRNNNNANQQLMTSSFDISMDASSSLKPSTPSSSNTTSSSRLDAKTTNSRRKTLRRNNQNDPSNFNDNFNHNDDDEDSRMSINFLDEKQESFRPLNSNQTNHVSKPIPAPRKSQHSANLNFFKNSSRSNSQLKINTTTADDDDDDDDIRFDDDIRTTKRNIPEIKARRGPQHQKINNDDNISNISFREATRSQQPASQQPIIRGRIGSRFQAPPATPTSRSRSENHSGGNGQQLLNLRQHNY